MPSVTTIRHVTFEDLGVWQPWFEANGWSVTYVDAPVADLAALDPLDGDLLIVLGGPIGAYQIDRYPFLADELRLIERRVAADKPLLGVCLGAQLLATACGASVSRMEPRRSASRRSRSPRPGGPLRWRRSTTCRCSIGTAINSICPKVRHYWRRASNVRTRRSRSAIGSWGCNFTRRPIAGLWKTGWSATHRSLPRPVSTSPRYAKMPCATGRVWQMPDARCLQRG